MEQVSLYDEENEQIYDFLLSADDARRVYSDINFATTLLNSSKKKNKVEEIEIQKDNQVIVQETTASDDAQSTYSCEENSLYRWSESAVLLLLRTYQEMERIFIDGKMSHRKCWELVAKTLQNQGHNVTGPQCASKLRSLKKTYKSIKEHNAKSGNDRRTWQHFEIMEEIFSKKAWCKPVAIALSSGLSKKNIEKEESSSMSCDNDSLDGSENNVLCNKKTPVSVPSLLRKRLAQREIHEEKKQKRHEDKMVLETKLLDVLTKLLNK